MQVATHKFLPSPTPKTTNRLRLAVPRHRRIPLLGAAPLLRPPPALRLGDRPGEELLQHRPPHASVPRLHLLQRTHDTRAAEDLDKIQRHAEAFWPTRRPGDVRVVQDADGPYCQEEPRLPLQPGGGDQQENPQRREHGQDSARSDPRRRHRIDLAGPQVLKVEAMPVPQYENGVLRAVAARVRI